MNKNELELLRIELIKLKEEIKGRGEYCQANYDIDSNLIFPLPKKRKNEFLAAQGDELSRLKYYHSSAALLYNYLSIIDYEHAISFLDEIFEDYELEYMLPILNKTDRKANIDAFLDGDNSSKTIFIESKFLEPLESIIRGEPVNNSFEPYLDESRYILEDPIDTIKMTILFEWVKKINPQLFNLVQIAKHISAIYTEMKLYPKKFLNKKVYIVNLSWSLDHIEYPIISKYCKLINDEINTIGNELNLILENIFDATIVFKHISYDDAINRLIRLDEISSKHKNVMTKKYMLNSKL